MARHDTSGLTGQAALVTGASSGLGRATAVALAHAGADVALLARSGADLQRVAREIGEGTGRRALPLPLDLADEEALLAAVDHAVAAFGRVDVLVNAAGTDAPGSVEELAFPDWDRVLAVNLRAPFVLAKAVFPHMRQAGRGTIANVSSVAASAAGPTRAPTALPSSGSPG
jgi:3-oxoacyl-[acyl-carrier protein] reductase